MRSTKITRPNVKASQFRFSFSDAHHANEEGLFVDLRRVLQNCCTKGGLEHVRAQALVDLLEITKYLPKSVFLRYALLQQITEVVETLAIFHSLAINQIMDKGPRLRIVELILAAVEVIGRTRTQADKLFNRNGGSSKCAIPLGRGANIDSMTLKSRVRVEFGYSLVEP